MRVATTKAAIDFENSGDSCLIDQCTFANNAGAAIEVLGLRTPQTTNIEIRNSRFIKNNTAHKLGPSEIYIWGKTPSPYVCCSSGTIQGNGYVLVPGVEFFDNVVSHLTDWTLQNNTAYATAEEIYREMPMNRPPVVDAGADLNTDQRTFALAGRVSDDGKPAGKSLSVTWEVFEGPGSVTFDEVNSPTTVATFEKPGDYLLRLVADDSELWTGDMVTVHILAPGESVAKGWEFNTNRDKEGWTEVNPGTQTDIFQDGKWRVVAPTGEIRCRWILHLGDQGERRRPHPVGRAARHRSLEEQGGHHPVPEPHTGHGNASEVHHRSRPGLGRHEEPDLYRGAQRQPAQDLHARHVRRCQLEGAIAATASRPGDWQTAYRHLPLRLHLDRLCRFPVVSPSARAQLKHV